MALQNPLAQQFQNSKDATHNSWKVTDISHAEIHDGNGYEINTFTTSLGASSWIFVQMNNASTSKSVHLESINLNHSAGLARVRVFEQTTASTMATGNTSLDVIQLNRNETSNTIIEAYSNPTLVSTNSSETNLIRDYLIGSTGSNAFGGANDPHLKEDEIVFKLNTTYVVRVDDLSGDAGYNSLSLFWYEDTV